MNEPSGESFVRLTMQELAELRHLCSVVAWIRTEQLYPESPLLHRVTAVVPDSTQEPGQVTGAMGVARPIAPIVLKRDMLNEGVCRAEFEAAQKWWRKFNQKLLIADLVSLQPSWLQLPKKESP